MAEILIAVSFKSLFMNCCILLRHKSFRMLFCQCLASWSKSKYHLTDSKFFDLQIVVFQILFLSGMYVDGRERLGILVFALVRIVMSCVPVI